VDAERALLGRQVRFSHLSDQAFGAHAVSDQVRDRNHQHLVPAREFRQLGDTGHAAVTARNLADHTRRVEPGDARQVHGRLGLARPDQHPSIARPEWEHVARPRQIVGLGPCVDGRQHRPRAICRRDAGRGAFLGLDPDAECGGELRRVLL